MRIYNILCKTQECPSFRLSHAFTEDSLPYFSSLSTMDVMNSV